MSDFEKREKPTAKRLRDARDKGQVLRSRDLSVAAGLLAAVGVLAVFGSVLIQRLGGALVASLSALDLVSQGDPTGEDISRLVVSGGGVLAMIVGPVALAASGASVLSALAQAKLSFSSTPLKPDLARLSPAKGLRRLAPSKSWVDTLKAIVGASIVVALAWHVAREVTIEAPRLAWTSLSDTAGYGWQQLLRLWWRVGLALVVLGAVDYGLQRWRHMSSLKMSRKDIHDENKLNEGRPEVKARVRRIQRDMARRRMLRATARATVVITNPTHYAVALEYKREKAPAPVVLAKGQNLLAARIREIARANEVPIVENPSLARALYAGAEVGETIPGPLFGAVAEVLAYLVRIRQLML